MKGEKGRGGGRKGEGRGGSGEEGRLRGRDGESKVEGKMEGDRRIGVSGGLTERGRGKVVWEW